MITLATKLFELLGTITVNNSDAKQKLGETGESVDKLNDIFQDGLQKISSWGLKITSTFGNAHAIMNTLMNTISNTIASGDEIDKASQRLGMSYTQYQEWAYIMDQCGMEIGSLEEGMMSLTNKMVESADPNSEAAKAFKMLGVSAYDSEGNLRDTAVVFAELVTAITSLENKGDKAYLSDMLFGSAGQNMLPMLNKTGTEIAALREEAHAMDLIMSDESVSAAVALNDSINTSKQAFGTFGRELAETTMPLLQEFFDFLNDTLYPLLKEKFTEDVLPAFKDALSVVKGVFEWFVSDGDRAADVLKNIGEAIVVAYGATHPWVGALLLAVEAIDRITGGDKDDTLEDYSVADAAFDVVMPGLGTPKTLLANNSLQEKYQEDVLNSPYNPAEGTYGPPYMPELQNKTTEAQSEDSPYGGNGGGFDGGQSGFFDSIPNMRQFYESLPTPTETGGSGDLSSKIDRLSDTIDNLSASNSQVIQGSVVLDSGAIVGYLMPTIDSRMGQIVLQKSRGSVG